MRVHNFEPFNVFTQMNHKRLVDETYRRFGYYSKKQAEQQGAVIYSTPSGGRVTVTAVYTRKGPGLVGWKDLVLVGEVVECVGRV